VSEQTDNPTCSGCGGPHPFDTTVPSVVWNAVIRGGGLPDYLCITCIVAAFVRANRSFTAELVGGGFSPPVPIEVRVRGEVAQDAAAISNENTRLRAELAAVKARETKLVGLLREGVGWVKRGGTEGNAGWLERANAASESQAGSLRDARGGRPARPNVPASEPVGEEGTLSDQTEGERCNACGRRYLTVYRVPDDLWAKVTGRTDGGGTWCPACFEFIAKEKRYSLYWEARHGEFPLEAVKAREEAAERLRARVLTVMERRGWSRHWTHRSAYLHLEAAELAEAIRGKRGDTLEESADVLMTLLAFSPHDLPEIIAKATEQAAELMTVPVLCRRGTVGRLGAAGHSPTKPGGGGEMMLRVRFHANIGDPRPVKWPVKHPFWVTGESIGSGTDGSAYATVVSYADDEAYIHEHWPEATHLEVEERQEYLFTDRFPKPEWFRPPGEETRE